MLKNIFTILYKDYRIELSQSHLFFSVVLYLLSSIYIIYLAFQPLGVSNVETWVSIFWVIILFGAITVVSKSFFQESYKRNYYYYYLFTPDEFTISFFYFLYQFSLLFFLVFLLEI